MGRLRIDRLKLNRMLAEGKPQREIAQFFGVTGGAISKAKGELKVAVVKNVALETAHKVVDRNLDTLGQLAKINQNANQILDGLMKEIETSKGGSARGQKDLREIALKASQEIRGQLSLHLEITKTLADVTAISDFQKVVITTIGEANQCPECGGGTICSRCGTKIDLRSQAIQKLKQARALRGSVEFKP